MANDHKADWEQVVFDFEDRGDDDVEPICTAADRPVLGRRDRRASRDVRSGCG